MKPVVKLSLLAAAAAPLPALAAAGRRPVAFVARRNAGGGGPRRRPAPQSLTASPDGPDAGAGRRLSAPMFSSSPDAIAQSANNNGNGSEGSAQALSSAGLDEARRLRERARSLRLEAVNAEQTLRSAMRRRKDAEVREADGLIDLLLGAGEPSSASADSGADGGEAAEATTMPSSNNNIPSAQTLSLRIKENQLGIAKLQRVVERLHERETAMMTGPEGLLSKQESTLDGDKAGGGFVLGDESNSLERKREEADRISGLLDRILEAVQLLDDDAASTLDQKSTKMASKLRIRVADLRQSRDALIRRRVDNLASATIGAGTKADGSIDDYILGSIDSGEEDDSSKDEKRIQEEKMMRRLIETPSWLPGSLAAFAATSPAEVEVSDWKALRADVLAGTDFICTSWDCTDVAAIYRGRLPRAKNGASTTNEEDGGDQSENSITAVFKEVQKKLGQHPELRDRIRLFLVDDYEWRPSFDAGGFSQSLGGADEDGPPPVMIALAREVEPEQESERGLGTRFTAALSSCLTAFTALTYAMSAFALNPALFDAVVRENDVGSVAPAFLPVFLGVLVVSALHMAGHAVVAKLRGVKLGRPVPLPSLQVGTFGSITPLRSFPRTRSALFDVAIGGPGISMLASVMLLVSGLGLTIGAESLATFPVVPAAMMKSSFLIGSIASFMAPSVMLAPLSQPIPVHPFFLVGLSGLVMNAVNLLPIGRLDGGRACMAVWGRRPARLVSFLSLLSMAVYSLGSLSGTAIFFGALIILCQQRLPDVPCVDEVTDVGGVRTNGYIALLALSLLTLVPFPGGAGPI